MKSIPIIVFVLLSVNSQAQDTSNDFFPLSVGNRWSYLYHNRDWVVPGDFITYNDGLAIYTIVSKSLTADSVIWRFQEVRTLTCRSGIAGFPPSSWTSNPVNDSTSFELVEYLGGNHRLTIPSTSVDPFVFLAQPISDSLEFSRYQSSALQDTLTMSQRNILGGISASVVNKNGPVQVLYDLSKPTEHFFHIADTLFDVHLTSVLGNESQPIVQDFVLRQNFPNPFNPTTEIMVSTTGKSDITINVYDILGRFVETIFSGSLSAGNHSIPWDAAGLSSGTYLCVANNTKSVKSIKLVLLK